MGCGRTFCKVCCEELIHRDHRKQYESASALGQIVYRSGPALLCVTDLDLVSRKGLKNGLQLLRAFEQKQPTHTFDAAQARTLRLLDRLIAYGRDECLLDPRSGVYVMRGDIAGATEGRRETRFHGPQEIERLATGEVRTIQSEEDWFRLLDPEDLSRRSRGAA